MQLLLCCMRREAFPSLTKSSLRRVTAEPPQTVVDDRRVGMEDLAPTLREFVGDADRPVKVHWAPPPPREEEHDGLAMAKESARLPPPRWKTSHPRDCPFHPHTGCNCKIAYATSNRCRGWPSR